MKFTFLSLARCVRQSHNTKAILQHQSLDNTAPPKSCLFSQLFMLWAFVCLLQQMGDSLTFESHSLDDIMPGRTNQSQKTDLEVVGFFSSPGPFINQYLNEFCKAAINSALSDSCTVVSLHLVHLCSQLTDWQSQPDQRLSDWSRVSLPTAADAAGSSLTAACHVSDPLSPGGGRKEDGVSG